MRSIARRLGGVVSYKSVAVVVGICTAAALHLPAWAQTGSAPTQQAEAGPRLGEGVAIEVNGTIVTSYDVYQRMRWLLFWSRLKPTRAVLVRVEQEARRMLVDEALQMQELQRVSPGGGLIVDNRAVEARIDAMARQRGLSSIELFSKLVDEDIDAETLYSMFRAQMSWDGYIQWRYSGRVYIDPNKVKERQDVYASNAARDQYRVREIVLPIRRGEDRADALEFAETLWSQILSGQISLGEAAEQFSASPSASKAGAIGWVSLDDLPPEAVPILARMTSGQISPPIEIKDAVAIYFVEEVVPAGGRDFADLMTVSAPTGGDTGGALASLSSLRSKASCASMDDSAATFPGIAVQHVKGATAATVSPSLRDWIFKAEVGSASEVVVSGAAAAFVVICNRYRQLPNNLSEDAIREELFLARLITLSKSELNRIRQAAAIVQTY